LLAACDRVVAPASQAATAVTTPVNLAASDFLDAALGDELFETRSAEIARIRAQAPAVKAFAASMAEDHAASTAALNRAIAAAGQNLAAPAGMSGHLQAMLGALGRGAEADFDKTYIEQQVEADEEALTPITAYARNGGVAPIRAAAIHLEATVKAHLDQARSIEGALNSTP
jgi:putative membrane protein